ncbi:MAG: Gfo/Idh/MocA family protein [Thermoguttaceae bacterium]
MKNGLLTAGVTSLMSSLALGDDTSKTWEPSTDKKIRVGLVGYGVCQFSAQFEFQHHPNVEVAAVSDLFPDRCSALAKRVACEKTYPSLEEMVKDDTIDAIFCATDAPSHARHAILCLEHGKHVCHAVPVFYGDIEEGERLLECCKKHPDLKYSMFETSCFHEDLYAMEKIYAAGIFGKLIYSEGEYAHPAVIGAPPLDSYGNWRANGAPSWYPTHASAYYVGVTHGSLLDVSAVGVTDLTGEEKPNKIGNVFRTEVAICRTSEGGIFRLLRSASQGEFLEAGRLRGQYAGYDGHNGRVSGFVGDETGKARMDEAIRNGIDLKRPALPPGVDAGGHGGSHGPLCVDFVDAILRDRPPRVGIIDALNMTVPGYYAHLSAVKDGETMKIPQYTL